VALVLPSLWAGFFADDYLQIGRLAMPPVGGEITFLRLKPFEVAMH
jgi:hypothetical protein